MRLLDRYLLRELLVPLGYCLGGFLIFYIAFDLIGQVNRFIEAHLVFSDIIEYYVATLPDLLAEQVLPVSLLLGMLYATTNHSRYHEITAIRAAGVSLWRLSVPYFATGAVFGLIVFLIGEFLLPSADERAKMILDRHLAVATERSQATRLTLHNEATHRDWTMSRFNRVTGEMSHPVLETQLSDGSVETHAAERADFRDGKWNLYNATNWVRSATTVFPNSTTNALLQLELAETPAWIRSELKFHTFRTMDAAKGPQFSMREIREYLRLHPQLDKDKKARLLTQFQARLASPFTCLAVVLIALPFGTRGGRQNVFVGVASSIFICFTYFIMQKISIGLGLGGYLPPFLAAWLPNMICGGTGLYLLSRVR